MSDTAPSVDAFEQQRVTELRTAQSKAQQLFQEIEKRDLIRPGISESQLNTDIYELAKSLSELSEKARTGTLNVAQMQGGSFTISSLGGIGGTAFTPIINAPEVAILGVSRSTMKPVFKDGAFVPRLMLPLSLSYDHRVIDGALAARFITYLSQVLAEPRGLLEAVP